MRIWSWQHVSVNISSVAELSPVYCCLVWIYIWKHTVEKSQTNAINVTLLKICPFIPTEIYNIAYFLQKGPEGTTETLKSWYFINTLASYMHWKHISTKNGGIKYTQYSKFQQFRKIGILMNLLKMISQPNQNIVIQKIALNVVCPQRRATLRANIFGILL